MTVPRRQLPCSFSCCLYLSVHLRKLVYFTELRTLGFVCDVFSSISGDKDLTFLPPHFPFPGLPSAVVSGGRLLSDELSRPPWPRAQQSCRVDGMCGARGVPGLGVCPGSPSAGVLPDCVAPAAPVGVGCWPGATIYPGSAALEAAWASSQHCGCFLMQEAKLPVLLISAYFLAAPRILWSLRSATQA